MIINRRTFVGSAAAGLATLYAPAVIGQARARVVVVGGGPGGATAAKFIAKDSQGKIDVTLVEPNESFVTCFHSNLYVGGYKKFDEITHRYDELTKKYGINHVRKGALVVKAAEKKVELADHGELAYDKLILSPGIDLKYDSVPGWGQEHEQVMPHAWKAGPQTQILRKRLDELKDGQVVVMIAPPNPYRCPPGPYERVSMMAHLLKSTGRGKCKIIVLDPKESFSKQGLFQEGWERHYPGMVEWIGPKVHDGIKSVDPKTNTVVTGFETYKDVGLVNVIPAQMAGKIARDAGLANQSGYCPIKPENMQSASDANIYILGDSSIAGDMPKSAFAANSQAKVAANVIRGELTQSRVFPPKYTNTCWSLIETDDAVKVGGAYEPKDGKIAAMETYISKTGETADQRKATQAENMGWYAGIVADMFS
jgi:NADH dehydrogenase FAD-containing subunit